MTVESDAVEDQRLRRRALRLEWATNLWNLMEVGVTVSLGLMANSLALIAFGLDSLVEVFASTVVIWHLRDSGPDLDDHRTHHALRLIAVAFFVLSACLLVASSRSLLLEDRPGDSVLGIAYLSVTACVMFGLAYLKRRVAHAMGSEPLGREAAMTFLDGCLSVGILTALVVSATLGWWWADAAAAGGVGLFAAYEGFSSWQQERPTIEHPETAGRATLLVAGAPPRDSDCRFGNQRSVRSVQRVDPTKETSMGVQDGERGIGIPPVGATEEGPDTERTRSRAIALVGGVFVVLMLVGVVLVARDDAPEPGLAKLPLLAGQNGAGSEKLAQADVALLPATRIRFELDGPIPELATTGSVSRFRLPPLDEGAVRDLALDLGVDEPATVRRDGESWVVSGAQRELTAFPSESAWSVGVNPRPDEVSQSSPPSGGLGGGSAPSDAIAQPTPMNRPEHLPSEADAERIAHDQLTAAGMIDSTWTAEVLDGGSVSIAVACVPDEQCPDPAPPVVTTRNVEFTKVVGGTPVAGLSWWVDVGDDGVIASVTGTFTELELLGEYPLRTARAAYVELTEDPYGDGPVPLGAAEARSAVDLGSPGAPIDPVEEVVVTITRVERATMLANGRVDGMDVMFVVPAYRFVGRYVDGTDFETIVNALDPSVIDAPTP